MRFGNRAIIAVLMGILVAAPLVVLGLGSGASRCVQGPEAAYLERTWTPNMMVNSPWMGIGRGNVTLDPETGGGVLGIPEATGGGVEAFFEITNWTVYTAEPQGGGHCSSPFLASAQDTANTVTAPIPVNPPQFEYKNDSSEPNVIGSNGSNPTPLFYDARFVAPSFTVSTCGVGPEILRTVSGYITVGLGFTSGGTWYVLDQVVPVVTYYSYVFPGNGGSWAVENLSAPGGPGGGYAFSYLGGC
jgi:hypothetical protein